MHRQTKSRRLAIAAGVVAGAASLLWAAAVSAAPEKAERTPCFFITQWNGWKSPSPNVLYLGVNLHDVYKVDLSAGSSQLQWPDVHLVSRTVGSDSVCSAIDLQLEVADTSGFREPLIASKLTKLTPEEVAAIPKKFRPN
jgi:hypothetical protein